MRAILFVLGAVALYLGVSTLRTAINSGYVTWLNTVRRADRPGLFAVYVTLSVLLLLAGIWAVGRAAMGLG